MATTHSFAAMPAGMSPAGGLGFGPAEFTLPGHQDDSLVPLVAFALAVQQGEGPTEDTFLRCRRQAEAALGAYALRHLHNRVEDIRQEAVASHLGQLRPPPSLAQLVLANLIALALAALAWAWLAANPALLERLQGLLAGATA